MIRERLGTLVSSLSPPARLVFGAWAAVALLGAARLLFKLPIPIFDLRLTEYGLVAGAALAILGVGGRDVRWLVVAALGAVIASTAGLAELVLSTRRWDALLYGLPLTLVAAPALAVFGHGVLTGRPTLAQRGMTAILGAFVVSLLLLAAAVLRGYVSGGAGTGFIALVTGVAIVFAGLTLWLGRGRGNHSET